MLQECGNAGKLMNSDAMQDAATANPQAFPQLLGNFKGSL
jgi:hypothetical protein